MKEKLVGNQTVLGFSTLEIVIALALMLVVISGAVSATGATEYWVLTAETATEGLYTAKTQLEELRAHATADFYSASTTGLRPELNVDDPIDRPCLAGGLCYLAQTTVTDISSCSKYVAVAVTWRMAQRYPTSTVHLDTNLTNNAEILASGGDCLLNTPVGNWQSGVLSESSSVPLAPTGISGFDVLQKLLYVSSSNSPQLQIFSAPTAPGESPVLIGSYTGDGVRINALDVIRDVTTGRRYAYLMNHASTAQLSVVDVTDTTRPTLVNSHSLHNVSSGSSYPEGWRVQSYGNRLYVTTRETAGPELHIFNTNDASRPVEVMTAPFELNRTVNDLVVREQVYDGHLRRFLFLAASAGLKEFSVIEVSDDVPIERVALDLPGSVDAKSITLAGNRVYLGRANGSGPELYQYDMLALLAGDTAPLATSEVGADVISLQVTGDLLYVGTGKTSEEFQVWQSNPSTWGSSVTNTGRLSFRSVPRLAPRGIEMSTQFIYSVSQSVVQPDRLRVLQAL